MIFFHIAELCCVVFNLRISDTVKWFENKQNLNINILVKVFLTFLFLYTSVYSHLNPAGNHFSVLFLNPSLFLYAKACMYIRTCVYILY